MVLKLRPAMKIVSKLGPRAKNKSDHSWGQFQQHFTCSFYLHSSQNRKKTDSLTVFLALLRSARIHAVGEIMGVRSLFLRGGQNFPGRAKTYYFHKNA